MRAAPAVDACLSAATAARALVLAWHLGAALLVVAWAQAWGWLPLAWPFAVALVLPFAAWLGVWQARQCLPPGPARLRWDGQGWCLLSRGQTEPLSVVAVQIDLGPALLLRLQAATPGRAARWAWALQGCAAADWHALRVALRYHAGATAASADTGLRSAG